MRIITALALCFCAHFLSAQLNPQVIAIPMRDGKSLAADLYLPSAQGTYPVILIQTPYNKNLFRLALPLNIGNNLSSSPYAFVVMDWRCFYASTAACGIETTRGEDGYDAVEWIAAQDWCDGQVATWGPSALGNIQFQTAREQPPHLVCAVPLVASPHFKYEHYFPGGVVLQEYLETLASLFGDAFSLVAQNPYYNLLWQVTENTTFYPDEIAIPMLHVGGWFDHNTEAVLEWFHAMREVSPAGGEQWMIMGPWTHGGTGLSAVGTAMQGELFFPEAQNSNNLYARAFLDHYLLGAQNGWEQTAPVTYFQMGPNTWLSSDVFPPQGLVEDEEYFLTAGLSMVPSGQGAGTSLPWMYDPTDPSPTIGGKTLSDEIEQGPYDQAVVEARGDNVIFSSPVLAEDVTVKGRIRARLWVSSDQPDTDIALRLTEVYPDGRSIALGQIIQRMRFREGYTAGDEALMVPGEVYEIEMRFDHIAQTFQAGNRIRLILTSSNYPWFNRNMNTGEEMYPNGNLDTLVQPQIATNHIHVEGAWPSRLILPVEQSSTSTELTIERTYVFPNPANQSVTLQDLRGHWKVNVHDMYGNLVAEKHGTSEQCTLETAAYTAGLYFATITGGGTERIAAFVVTR